jgi:hypothetical protein
VDFVVFLVHHFGFITMTECLLEWRGRTDNHTEKYKMSGSGLFNGSKFGPANPAFMKPGGKRGEILKLRQDCERALQPAAAITVEEFTNPAAGGAAVLKIATATVASPVTVLAAALLAPGLAILAAQPRNITFTTAGTTAADAPATALITGTDVNDAAQTETVTLAQTATIATGVKLFKTITSIVYPAADGTGATVAIGIGDAMGLSKTVKSRAGGVTIVREVVDGALVVTGALASASAAPPYGSYTPATAPNGTHDYAVYYEYDPSV